MIRHARAMLLVLLVAPTAVLADSSPVAQYHLGHGVLGRLDADGTVQVGVLVGTAWKPLLRVSWPHRQDGRGDLPAAITATVPGDTGGRLSDLMGIWDRTLDGRGRRLETHHWSRPHLEGLMVAFFSSPGGGIIENLCCSLAMPGSWAPVDEVCPSVASAPEMPQFLAHVADPRPGEPPLWLGIALLDLQPRRPSDCWIHIERADLLVPLLDARQEMAIAVGPTRLRVMEDLAAAVRLQEGSVDPSSGRLVRWTGPIGHEELHGDRIPRVRLRRETRDRFSLVFRVSAEQHRFWDPDLFRLGGQGLGPADRLVWTDESGRRALIEWSGDRSGRRNPCRPYETLGAVGAGTLEIHFAGPRPPGFDDFHETPGLEVVHLDGRRGVSVPDPDGRAELVAHDDSRRPGDDNRGPQLSPGLLVASPNPFQATTRIVFRVPGTYGEAFAPEDGRELVFDPQQRMPYADGAASVQVSVFSLEGREIATLFAGLAGEGTYEVSWDGRDREGRTLASGTYFCRLQVDRWSVTRRLIFIR